MRQHLLVGTANWDMLGARVLSVVTLAFCGRNSVMPVTLCQTDTCQDMQRPGGSCAAAAAALMKVLGWASLLSTRNALGCNVIAAALCNFFSYKYMANIAKMAEISSGEYCSPDTLCCARLLEGRHLEYSHCSKSGECWHHIKLHAPKASATRALCSSSGVMMSRRHAMYCIPHERLVSFKWVQTPGCIWLDDFT